MIKKLKVMGLTVIAVFAFTAVSAVAAQAANFHSEASTTNIKGTQEGENIFTTAAGNVKCKVAEFTDNGVMGTSVPSLEITPKYEKCTAFGQTAEVTTNDTWTFTAPSATEGKVVLNATNIVINVPSGNCSVTVPAQTPGTPKVKYTNGGSGSTRNVLVTSEVAKITYSVAGTGTICGTTGTHTEAASYSGKVLVKGFNTENAQVGVWVE